MAAGNQNIFRQVYNSKEDVRLLAAVESIYCVFFRRGLLAAAFNEVNELLTVHYAGYGTDRPVWEIDFFEPLLSTEPLLSDVTKIKKVFFCTENTLITPELLFDKEQALEWMKTIYFIEPVNDEVKQYFAKDEKNYVLYAVPKNIYALVKINCPTVPIFPLSAYQFKNNYSRGVRVHCMLTPEQAMCSIYHYGSLLWHQVFDYGNAEDVAYMIRKVCEEHKINGDKITINSTASTAVQYEILRQLSAYFADVTTASGHEVKNLWSPVLSLIKELESCE